MQFTLGEFTYSSKNELKLKLSKYLQATPSGHIITEYSKIKQLTDLLYLHYDYTRKIGSGIKFFFVKRNEVGSGKCFAIRRTDESIETFSYKSCLDGDTQTKRAKTLEALRFAIKGHMRAYRESLNYPIRCALSNEVIKSPFELHVDHVKPTFYEIVSEFLHSKSMELEHIKIIGNGESIRLSDNDISNEFYRFHARKAVYQALTKEAHIEKTKNYDTW
jgi:hypothetical protein